jgi:heme-degrading monooxygenase HmoA
MAVTVLIERTVQPSKAKEIEDLLLTLRSLAIRQEGYISGETWVSADDPNTYIVIGTWKTQADWWKWENSPMRKSIAEAVASLLVMPERVRIFKEP